MTESGDTAASAARAGTPAPREAYGQALYRRAARTIRGRLLLLTFAVLVPAVLAAAVLLLDAWRTQRHDTERQLMETARAITVAVDRQVGQGEATLRALATSPHLETGDFAAFDRQARRVAAGSQSWIVLTDEKGVQRVNTYLPQGVAPPGGGDAGFAERWAVLNERGRAVSNLFTGKVAQSPAVAVEIPVGRGGRPAYDLMLVMSPYVPAKVFADQRMPRAWTGGLMDRNGVMIARSRDMARFVGVRARDQALKDILTRSQSVADTRTAEGVPVLAVRNRSTVSGWTVFVAVPKAELNAGVGRSIALTAVAGLALLALGAALALWVARGVVRPVEGLAAAAEALGRGEPLPELAGGMTETDAVAEALRVAGDRLRAREDELRRLNETLEERVKDGAERLVQAQKLEAVGRLTGGIAHDFNNLLTAVLGNLELLGRRISDERLRRYVVNAREAAQRGASLTGQLLAFARKQRLTPEATDVNLIIGDMQTLLASTLGGSVRVQTELASGLAPALADRTQLELTLLNLAINARDAMPNGGLLRLVTAEVLVEAAPARPSDPPPGYYVRLSVCDQGEGMTSEVLDRVLEPFFTTKAPGRGSGLGLPHVLGVVQQLGGGLVIDSVPGEGTSVHVFLPRAASPALAAAPAEPVTLSGRVLAGKTVLLVDDDDHVRQAAGGLLRELGAVAIGADGPEAARLRRDQGVAWDLALIDWAMPGANGAELAAELAAGRPGAPCVLMTGFADSAALQAVWTGPVLQKPFTPEALAEILVRALQAARAAELA
jgi:signal transduction histidine kinase/CheY-like chemotaxis protein